MLDGLQRAAIAPTKSSTEDVYFYQLICHLMLLEFLDFYFLSDISVV